ncbi:MAG: ATP synthase subunit a [Chloroflexota bacterium]|jgi:F-type H+-transporting ATPase subunit a|nr:F0F1 ATP synthase subunit A [Caldilinea sp.]GIK71809.1 MAG: ATP synthase subunit a [Chloroflexota bacterium]
MGKKIVDFLWGTKQRKIWTSVIVGLFAASILINFIAPVPPPHVALSGEPIFSTGPKWFTNSVLTTIIVDIILLLLALATRFSLKEVPGGLQNFMEAIIEALYGLAESVAGKNAGKFFPWVVTIFLFVIISNWSGLIPGVGSIGFYHPYPAEEKHGEDSHAYLSDNQLAMAGGSIILAAPESVQAAPAAAVSEKGKFIPLFRAPSADLNMTFALAISTMVMVQIWGVRHLGGSYFRKFFNFSGPNGFMKGINGFVGILELISEFSRVLAFGFRLFGNIFAGEIILFTMTFLIAFLLPVPFYVLEVFVGFVQALVFMMLALVFFQMSTISHGSHDEHH